LSLGRGEKPPSTGTPPVEFEEVFGAFERMASDIRSSQAALESARRRTAAVLGNVATGVLALDPAGSVIIANPRAQEMLGRPLVEGAALADVFRAPWEPLAGAVSGFLSGREVSSAGELEVNSRRLRYQLARLGGDPGGAVLALDDITDVTQAERVLAWGEMARQVAHEIKNPLTPLRLGIQHLRRAYRDRRGDFDETLEITAGRILMEIDRLDTIARAFSRFGLPVGENAPLESVPLLATAREVADLYQLGGDGIRILVEGDASITRPARKDEVKEVLGNLLENARNAGAGKIALTVSSNSLSVNDDGQGIPSELLPRIFEPRFSTTTSGSGLGLAIVKRLVESWGASVEVQSGERRGTQVLISWEDHSTRPPDTP
jgi:nitrogen fixation/metabolism regulation signal transduction histidine kinase